MDSYLNLFPAVYGIFPESLSVTLDGGFIVVGDTNSFGESGSYEGIGKFSDNTVEFGSAEVLLRCYVDCYGVDGDEPEVCSGHGICSYTDNCTCEEDFGSELDCSITFCFGVASSESVVCGLGRGECVGLDECECVPHVYYVDGPFYYDVTNAANYSHYYECVGCSGVEMYVVQNPEEIGSLSTVQSSNSSGHCVPYGNFDYYGKFSQLFGNDEYYDISSEAQFNSIAMTSDGGYVLCGELFREDDSRTFGFISKHSSSGALQWVRVFDFGKDVLAKECLESSDGGFVVTGEKITCYEFFYGLVCSTISIFVCKFNSNASVVEWCYDYACGTPNVTMYEGELFSQWSNGILDTTDGYLVVGYGHELRYGSSFSSEYGGIFLKLTNEGELEWARKIVPGGGLEVRRGLAVESDSGGFIVAVAIEAAGFYMASLHANGSSKWSRRFEYGEGRTISSLLRTQDDGIVVVDCHWEYLLVLKFDGEGDVVWTRSYLYLNSDEGDYFSELISILETPEDGSMVVGGSRKANGWKDDTTLLKFNSSGHLEWVTLIGGDGDSDSLVNSLVRTPDGGYGIAGTHTGYAFFSHVDMWGMGCGVGDGAWVKYSGLDDFSTHLFLVPDDLFPSDDFMDLYLDEEFDATLEIFELRNPVEITELYNETGDSFGWTEVLCMDECSGKLLYEDDICSGHGVCLGGESGECICEQPYILSSNCDWECFGFSSLDTENVCNGNGTCVDYNVCECDNGFLGTECETVTCNDIRFDFGEVCNSNGECKGPDQCVCEETPYGSYFGEWCEEWECGGISKTDVFQTCNGRGTCYAPNQCACVATEEGHHGYYGRDCKISMVHTFARSTLNLLVVNLEIKDDFLSEERYSVNMSVPFDCSVFFRVDTSVHGDPDGAVHKIFEGENCLLSEWNEFTQVDGYSHMLKIDISHLSEEEMEKIFSSELKFDRDEEGDGELENELHMIVYETPVKFSVFPSYERTIEDPQSYTLRSFSINEGDSGDIFEAAEDTQLCKDKLMIGDKCLKMYECHQDDNPDTDWFSMGFVPDTASSRFFYSKFYFPDKTTCEDGVDFREYKIFSLVSCYGSEFGDNFVLYERCKDENIFFGGDVIAYFGICSAPMVICVIPCLFVFYCLCSFNCLLWGFQRCIVGIKQKRKGATDEIEGDDEADEQVGNVPNVTEKVKDPNEELEDEILVGVDGFSEDMKVVDGYYQNGVVDKEKDDLVRRNKFLEAKNEKLTTLLQRQYAFLKKRVESRKKTQTREATGSSEGSTDESSDSDGYNNTVHEEENEGGLQSKDIILIQMDEDDEKEDELTSDSTATSSSHPSTDVVLEEDEQQQQQQEEEEEEEEEEDGEEVGSQKKLKKWLTVFCFWFSFLFAPCCNPKLKGFYQSFVLICSIMIREGMSLWFSCQEFIGTSDIDTSNQYYIVLESVMSTTSAIIGGTIGLYLALHICMILLYVRRLHYDPIMFCVGYGSLKEYVFFRIFKSTVLAWLMCVNAFAFLVKFLYLDSVDEQNLALTDYTFWMGILLPQCLLFFSLVSVLKYNGVSSHAHRTRLNKLKWCDFINFPRVKGIGIGKLFSDTDQILEDFFQLILLVEEDLLEGPEKGYLEMLEEYNESEDYGHLGWEYLNSMKRSEVKYLRNFFFPQPDNDDGGRERVKKERMKYWTVFNHYQILTMRWCKNILLYPFVCVRGTVREKN